MVDLILGSLDDDKAQDVLAIDLVGKTSIADRMIIASGTSARMVSAMAEHLMIKLREVGLKPKSEGQKHGDWVLVDAGDVIVHLFRPEVRTFYNIERIWAAPAKTDKPTAERRWRSRGDRSRPWRRSRRQNQRPPQNRNPRASLRVAGRHTS